MSSPGFTFVEGLAQARQVIVGHKMRSALLIVGVAIGVATLLAIYTIVSGLSGKIRDDVVSANRPYVYVTRFSGLSGDIEKKMRRPQIEADVIEPLQGLPSVDLVDYWVSNGEVTELSYGQERANFVQMQGTGSNFPLVLSLDVADGRFFTEEEVQAHARVCVLGHGPAESLFPMLDPIGKELWIEGRPYTVVGVIAKRGTVFGSFGENYLVLPWTSFEKDYLGNGFENRELAATIASGFEADETVADMTGMLRRLRRLRPGEGDDFDIVASETFGDIVDQITGGIAMVLVVLSSIGLMVGGIGVMNIMLISVTERTREIGVRMALGARRSEVLLQVLIEAGALTGIGGLVGIGVGIGLSRAVTAMLDFPYAVSIPWTLGAAFFSVAIGLVFGLYPASRASKLDPIEALRAE